jgi:2-dehydro-3-deoxyphosphogluconate aldolase/(4S)-4-hydroxy-2-oxoglutarate aldolase
MLHCDCSCATPVALDCNASKRNAAWRPIERTVENRVAPWPERSQMWGLCTAVRIATLDLRAHLRLAPVVPVLTIERVEDAVPLARALVSGGLKVLEVTLRTPCALDALKRISEEVEGAVPAAGTVLNTADVERAAAAGAAMAFSPGIGPFAAAGPIPVCAGVASASEIMQGLEMGLATFKFFPAAAAGGTAALKAFAGPFGEVGFCPTGGIGAGNAAEVLALSNVLCVGGSWVAPAAAVAEGRWDLIESLAREAAALGA